MAKKVCFTKYKNEWDIHKWQSYCPELTYNEVKLIELPAWLPQGLVSKFNTAVVASSGNTEVFVVVIMGYRIDGSFIDEHPYVVAFDKNSGKSYSGIIHHGDWAGRTTKIPPKMKKLMRTSGITTNFRFSRKPDKPKGTLAELKRKGILGAFAHSVKIIERKRRKR
jgi:hypothetical protein